MRTGFYRLMIWKLVNLSQSKLTESNKERFLNQFSFVTGWVRSLVMVSVMVCYHVCKYVY